MGILDIGQAGNIPTAQSQNVYMVTRKTQAQIEQAIRENYALLDEIEPGQYLGAFPLGYPCNTTK